MSLLAATVEAVLLYGCEAWTLTAKLEKQLDGCYTRMLRAALGIHWTRHMTNEDLYRDLPKITTKIRERRLKFAGHCYRREEELASKLLLWEPTHGERRRGRPALSYLTTLKKDTGLEKGELESCMNDRKTWRAITVQGHHSL